MPSPAIRAGGLSGNDHAELIHLFCHLYNGHHVAAASQACPVQAHAGCCGRAVAGLSSSGSKSIELSVVGAGVVGKILVLWVGQKHAGRGANSTLRELGCQCRNPKQGLDFFLAKLGHYFFCALRENSPRRVLA